MQQEQELKPTSQSYPHILEFYFCESPRTLSPLDKLLSWAISKYQSWWGWDSNLQHIIVRLGDDCYELTVRGLVKYQFHPGLLDMPRLFGGWVELLDDDQAEVIKRVLDRQLEYKPKLDLWHNLVYYICIEWLEFWADYDFVKESADVKFAEIDNTGTLKFNLPYTCVTPALLALDTLVDYDKDTDSHLPPTLFAHCLALASIGIGALWWKGQ